MQFKTYVEGGHVRANGIRQHYLRFGGKGRQLVVVPGITMPAATFAEFADDLGRFFDVYVPDARGRGLSERGDHLDYGLEALAADLSAFVEALRLTDYALVGHSMGGRIVPAAVARHGARPRSVVLADPPMTGPGRRGYSDTDAWFTDQIAKAARGDMTVEEMRTCFPMFDDDQLALRIEWLPTCDPRAIERIRADFLIDDMHSVLPTLGCPILVLAAERGAIRSEEVAELSAMEGVECVVLPGTGHMIPWDDRDAFRERIVGVCGADGPRAQTGR